MNRILFSFTILMLLMGSMYAFTPTIDGVKDSGWGTTPTHNTYTTMQPTGFNLDGGCYVTDDANYVYIGIPTDNDPWGDGASIHMHVAIDVKNTTSGGTSDAWGSSIVYAQTYKPDFDIITQWSTDSPNVGWTGFQTWTGSAWSQTQLTNIAGGGNQFTEMAIARSVFGNIALGETINISVWLRPDWSKNGASSCLPADAGFAADWGNGWGLSFTTQFSYAMTTELADMIAPRVVSMTQLSPTSFNLVFNEPMNETNAVITTNYTYGGGMSISSISEVNSTTYTFYTTAALTGGSTYTVTALPAIKDVAGNSIDTGYNVGTLVANYYTDVTFQINMNLEIISGGFVPSTDQVYVRGGFNGWGTTQLLDADNNGIYTVTLSLPYGVGTYFEFKYWNNHLGGDNWESVANRNYTIVSGDNTIPTVYWNNADPSSVTTHPINVTFKVDMSNVSSFTNVYVAGTFNGWNGTANPMTAAKGVYQTTVMFPAYTNKYQEYKYLYDSTWEYIDNRSFNLDDGVENMILQTVFFNNIEVELPVELSSFTAVTFNETTVSIQWTSQSETDMLGYNVYRNTSPDIDAAVRINNNVVAATNTSTTQTYSVQDNELASETTYFYWLESVNLDASNEFFGPVTLHFGFGDPETPNPNIPQNTTLFAAYPNPFNPSTTLSFRMEKGGNANLNVYNVKGELIKRVFNGPIAAGTWRWTWDGTDISGNSVGSGVYYYRLDVGSYHKTNKMVLLK